MDLLAQLLLCLWLTLFAVFTASTANVVIEAQSSEYRPFPGGQTRAHQCTAFEMLFGGAAGPGKTLVLLMEATRQINNPRYTAVIFRRSYAMLEDAGGLIQRSLLYYPRLGGVYNIAKHYWTFPSGARIYFRYLEKDKDLDNYQGAQYCCIFFDELTQFEEKHYLFMFSRCRVDKDSGLRSYIRATCNPQPGWVKDRFVTRDIVNKVRYFIRVRNSDGEEEDIAVPKGTPHATSRTFIPASHLDNPMLSKEYIASLHNLDTVQKERLLNGNWDIDYTAGLVYPNWLTVPKLDATGAIIDTGNVISVPYNEDLPIWWACDDGFVEGKGKGDLSYHPRIVLICQPNELGGLNVIDEYVATGEISYATTIANVRAMGYKEPEIAVCDSSAAMFLGSLWNEGITNIGGSHPVHEGIRNIRALIGGNGQPRLLRVHPRCQYFIYEIVRYKQTEKERFPETGEPKPVKANDHTLDALRYLCWRKVRIISISRTSSVATSENAA